MTTTYLLVEHAILLVDVGDVPLVFVVAFAGELAPFFTTVWRVEMTS